MSMKITLLHLYIGLMIDCVSHLTLLPSINKKLITPCQATNKAGAPAEARGYLTNCLSKSRPVIYVAR